MRKGNTLVRKVKIFEKNGLCRLVFPLKEAVGSAAEVSLARARSTSGEDGIPMKRLKTVLSPPQ